LLRRHWIEDIGVAPEDHVVVYDDADGRWAARIVWTLRFLGYPRASVLDGGLAGWRGMGGEIEKRVNDAREVENPPIEPQRGWYLVTSELLPLLSDPNVVLVDVRTEEERRDDIDETIPPGSIPGSVAIPWTDVYAGGSGHLRPESELRALFADRGVTPERTVVLYARLGTETAHTWLVLKLLGYPTVMIYDGGWVDWSTDPTTPKELLAAD
jgi:thiosulfate/3-mercaptopyruvate sulfurtransferase